MAKISILSYVPYFLIFALTFLIGSPCFVMDGHRIKAESNKPMAGTDGEWEAGADFDRQVI
jgi:hypothetical protein